MATDQVPPIADELPTVEPETAPARVEDDGGPRRRPGYRQPEVDVDAMRTLLDGRYGEVRDLVRDNLAEHAQILLDQEQMTTADFRERVRDVVVMMAETGQTGMGFPEEYGGGGDIGASIAAFETLALGDLSVLVKVGVQFGLFGGAILQLGTKHHHDALPRRPRQRPHDGLLRDDRERPRLQRAGARHRGDVRRRGAGVRDHDARRREPQGLHRQRGRPRRAGRRLRPARGRRRAPRRARLRRPAPRGRPGARRRPHRGLRPQDGPQRRRQRPHLVRRGPGAAHRAAQPVRRGDARGPLPLADRQPQQALLHHARHPRPGPRLRRRRRHQRVQGRAHHRHPLRRAPPPVRGDRRPTRSRCSSTTACTSAACCRSSRGRTPSTSRRRSSPGSCTRSSPAPARSRRAATSTPGGCWSRAPPAPRRSAPGTRPAPSRSAARRAAARATSARTGSPR